MELKIENFKNTIINSINNAELPLALSSYILKEVLSEIDSVRSQSLAKEKQEQQEQGHYPSLPIQEEFEEVVSQPIEDLDTI